MTSHGDLNHQGTDNSFDSLFGMAKNKISKLSITAFFWKQPLTDGCIYRRAIIPESVSKLERIKQTIPHYIDYMSIPVQSRHMSGMTFHITGILILILCNTVAYWARWCLKSPERLDCLLNRLFTSKIRVTDLCVGNSPATGEFCAHRGSNTENASIWWRHHGI